MDSTKETSNLESGDCNQSGQSDTCSSYGRFWSVLPPRTRSMVCRTSVATCAFILCVHVLLVSTVDVGKTVDKIVRQQASIVVPNSNHHSSNSHQVEKQLSRLRRDVSPSEQLEGKGLNFEAAKHGEEGDEQRLQKIQSTLSHLEKDEEKNILEEPKPSSAQSSRSLCRHGHIQGLTASICDAQPCLRRLQRQESASEEHQQTTDDVMWLEKSLAPSSFSVLRRINQISGRLDSVHFSLLPFIVRFQWTNGIYGSVGEFGASQGKFTALLSTFTDVDSGERLFVCDSFNRSTDRSIAGISSFQMFTSHMNDFGFSEVQSGPRRLYLHRGTSRTLETNLLSTWDLPQFRLISIDSNLDRLNLLSDLEMAVCLLRDGGVIVINGLEDSDSKHLTSSTLASFFRKHGQSAVTPILSAGNKLYLTTSNWKRKYIKSLTNDVVLQHLGLAQSAVMEPFSSHHLSLS